MKDAREDCVCLGPLLCITRACVTEQGNPCSSIIVSSLSVVSEDHPDTSGQKSLMAIG